MCKCQWFNSIAVNKGEQVDLFNFPPVCLPAQGQNFGGSDGVIAGMMFRFEGLKEVLLGGPPFLWRTWSILPCNAVRRMGTCKWGCYRWMVLLWCSSRSQGCKSSLYSCFEPHVCLSQVPIITKADCMKNMEENGLGFIEGVLCAGGNTNGTCQVWKEDLFEEKDKKYILASSTSSQCIKIHRVIAEEPWRQKMGCWLVLSVLQDQTSVGRWCFSTCLLCVLKWL